LILDLKIEGLITDRVTKLILPNVNVELLDNDGSVIASTITDSEGKYNFSLAPDMGYQVKATKEKYFENNLTFDTKELALETKLLKKDLQLVQFLGLENNALVVDSKTGLPMDSVTMSFTDNFTGKKFLELKTPETGLALKSILNHFIDDTVSLNIDLMKVGYTPKTLFYNGKISKPGIIDIHQMLVGGLTLEKELTPEEVEQMTNKDLAAFVRINPINFDLDKYNIRQDAKIELDKIIAIMNKYPEMEVELGAHTDCRASIAYNEQLSDRRAKTSAGYIKSKITNPSRIYGKGYGESRLLNDCGCEGNVFSNCSEEEHEKNRRTEFRVVKTGVENLKVINTSPDSFDN
jgi:outer membrane protein OmpA-like peptidoglycan-associated protein